jgi:hypothetical protein
LEQPTYSLLATNDLSRGKFCWSGPRKQQTIAFASLISFGMVMFAEVRQGAAQREFAEQNEQGKDIRFGPSVSIALKRHSDGAACGQQHAVDPVGRESLAEVRTELLVAIVPHVVASFPIARLLARRVAKPPVASSTRPDVEGSRRSIGATDPHGM